MFPVIAPELVDIDAIDDVGVVEDGCFSVRTFANQG